MNMAHRLSVLAVLALVGSAGCISEVDASAEGDDPLRAEDVPGECEVDEVRECDPSEGNAVCNEVCLVEDGVAVWGDRCEATAEENFQGCACARSECNTPLVLAFENERVAFTAEQESAFYLSRDGVCKASDWPTAATPWLVLDRDNDGAIEDGGELFGSATKLSSGRFAKNGFEALRDLDENRDGTFNASDPAFSRVAVWKDANGDRVSSSAELRSLSDVGLIAIDLADQAGRLCDGRGNCEGERSAFEFRDVAGVARRGTVIDVYLRAR
jgi:hypothetical protein